MHELEEYEIHETWENLRVTTMLPCFTEVVVFFRLLKFHGAGIGQAMNCTVHR